MSVHCIWSNDLCSSYTLKFHEYFKKYSFIDSTVLISVQAVSGANEMDVFVTVHPSPDFKSALEPDKREVNLLYHPWVFRDEGFVSEANQQAVVEMGVFSPYNVTEVTEAVCEDTDLLNGIAVNRMEERIVEVVRYCVFAATCLQTHCCCTQDVHTN